MRRSTIVPTHAPPAGLETRLDFMVSKLLDAALLKVALVLDGRDVSVGDSDEWLRLTA